MSNVVEDVEEGSVVLSKVALKGDRLKGGREELMPDGTLEAELGGGGVVGVTDGGELEEVSGEEDLYSAEGCGGASEGASEKVDEFEKFGGHHADFVDDEDVDFFPDGAEDVVVSEFLEDGVVGFAGRFDASPGVESFGAAFEENGGASGESADLNVTVGVVEKVVVEGANKSGFAGASGSGEE